jgi:hypothetical protein
MATVIDEPASARAHKPGIKAENGLLLVDLGKKSRKQIKRLRKGQGKLVDEVNRCLQELRSAGTATESQPVVVVVREKRPRFDWFQF